jgi:hypothetical protein
MELDGEVPGRAADLTGAAADGARELHRGPTTYSEIADWARRFIMQVKTFSASMAESVHKRLTSGIVLTTHYSGAELPALHRSACRRDTTDL